MNEIINRKAIVCIAITLGVEPNDTIQNVKVKNTR